MANKNIFNLGSITVPLAGTEVIPIWNGTTTTKVTVANLTVGRAVVALSLASSAGTVKAEGSTSGNVVLQRTAAVGAGSEASYLDTYAPNASSTNIIWSRFKVVIDAATAGAETSHYVLTQRIAGGFTDVLATDATGNLVPKIAAKGINFTANTPAAGMTSQLLNWYEEGTWTPSFSTWTTAPTEIINNKYTRIGRLVTLNCLNRGGTIASGNSITGLPFTPSAQGAAAFITMLTGTPTTIPGSIDGSSASIQNLGVAVFGTQYWTLSTTYSI